MKNKKYSGGILGKGLIVPNWWIDKVCFGINGDAGEIRIPNDYYLLSSFGKNHLLNNFKASKN